MLSPCTNCSLINLRQIVTEIKSYAKASNKYPQKKQAVAGPDDQSNFSSPILQSKIVLLTIAFPRLRIIWSSSPYATSDIFNDLKANNPEPDPIKAISLGADNDPEAGAGVNSAAEEVLRSLPGITMKNYKSVMAKVKSIKELCEMNFEQMKGILGAEAGKACYEFIHRGDKQ
jgi:DNA excision repair protein ERCC-4